MQHRFCDSRASRSSFSSSTPNGARPPPPPVDIRIWHSLSSAVRLTPAFTDESVFLIIKHLLVEHWDASSRRSVRRKEGVAPARRPTAWPLAATAGPSSVRFQADVRRHYAAARGLRDRSP